MAGAFLEHLNGDNKDDQVELDQLGKEEIVLGRDQTCDIVTEPTFTSVSSRHAILRQSPRGWTIADEGSAGAGSTYGTYINGNQLIANQDVWLQPGDTIRLGSPAGKYFQFRDSRTITERSLGSRISVDQGKRQVLLDGRPIALGLSPNEFRFLSILCDKHGELCNYEETFAQLWPDESMLDRQYLRSRVNALAMSLRKKCETALGSGDVVENIPGDGYLLRT